MADEQDVAAYLLGKGIATYRAAGTEVTAHCWFCPDGDPKAKGKLYVNTESWLYDCKRCGAQGNRKTLLEHFGDDDTLTYVAGSDPMVRRRVLTEAAELAHQMLLANDQMLEYLLGRGLSPETIERRKYGYVPQNVGLTSMLPCRQGERRVAVADLIGAGLLTVGGQEFFNHSLVIPYWTYGSVVQLREKKIDGKYRTAAGDRTRLYNVDALRTADDVVVTEGEYDCDMVEQALQSSGLPKLIHTAVVGLAGAGSWPENLIDYFSGARRVFIGLDPDDTGKKYAAKLRDELGQKARIIRLPEQLPKCDWSDYLNARSPKNPHGGHSWRDVQQLLTTADLAGKRMFSVSDAHTKWTQQRSETPGIKLGWASIDAILRPGIKPGQVMVPLAKTGTGKSVLLSNIVHNLASRRTLFLSLELTAEEVFEHLRRIHKFWLPEATEDERDLYYANLRIVDQNRIGKGDLTDYIREYEELVGAKPEVTVVDYLQYYSRGFRGDQYSRVSDATMEIKAVAKEEKTVFIVPSQVNRGAEDGKPLTADDARDSGVIEETADFVVSLFRPDQMVNRNSTDGALPMQTGALNAQLLKSRHGGRGRVFNFRMSLMSLAIVDAKFDQKAALRVDQENTLYRTGKHYDDYRAEQVAAHAQQALL